MYKVKVALFYIIGISTLYLIYETRKKHSITNLLIQKPLILMWTQFVHWKPQEFNELNCEYSCTFTYDRDLLNVSNCVLFNWGGIKSNDLPNVRHNNQHWIVAQHESPAYPKYSSKLPEKLVKEVNWVISYRRDSSIFDPYGKVVEREIAVPYKLRTQFNSKTRNVAWFVTHCKTTSKREVFVKEVSTFIDFDIYGRCGNLTCGSPTYKKKDDIMSCYLMVENKYKFYYSAENAFCNDYITEKLFFILDFEIIPIVYGGANYSAILPPNSYIDARNFTKPAELADFLHKVGSDEQIYYSYFKWKSNYKVLNAGSWKEEKLPHRMCEMCKGLYSPSTVKDFRGTGINEWWFNGQCE